MKLHVYIAQGDRIVAPVPKGTGARRFATEEQMADMTAFDIMRAGIKHGTKFFPPHRILQIERIDEPAE